MLTALLNYKSLHKCKALPQPKGCFELDPTCFCFIGEGERKAETEAWKKMGSVAGANFDWAPLVFKYFIVSFLPIQLFMYCLSKQSTNMVGFLLGGN